MLEPVHRIDVPEQDVFAFLSQVYNGALQARLHVEIIVQLAQLGLLCPTVADYSWQHLFNHMTIKLSYDACFNAWFAGYLEPTLSAQQQQEKQKHPEEYAKQKADEYQQKCGKIWENYRDCVQKAIKDKGLTELLDQARDENPLKEPPPPVDISQTPPNTS